jgi:hypothetical protein
MSDGRGEMRRRFWAEAGLAVRGFKRNLKLTLGFPYTV